MERNKQYSIRKGNIAAIYKPARLFCWRRNLEYSPRWKCMPKQLGTQVGSNDPRRIQRKPMLRHGDLPTVQSNIRISSRDYQFNVLWICPSCLGDHCDQTTICAKGRGGRGQWHSSRRTGGAGRSSTQPTEDTQRTSHRIRSMRGGCHRPNGPP